MVKQKVLKLSCYSEKDKISSMFKSTWDLVFLMEHKVFGLEVKNDGDGFIDGVGHQITY